MKHIRNKDNTGNMILQELDYTQLIAGVGTTILDDDTAACFLTWTDPSWVTSIKQFLVELQAGFRVTQGFRAQPQ